MQRKAIPRALREQVWLRWCGRVFESPCSVGWCANVITVFDFHVGHNLPHSRGGSACIDNLRPLCARCNLSMGDRWTIDEFDRQHRASKTLGRLAPSLTSEADSKRQSARLLSKIAANTFARGVACLPRLTFKFGRFQRATASNRVFSCDPVPENAGK